MTDTNGWLDRAREIAQEQAAKKAQEEAAREAKAAEEQARRKLENTAKAMQFFQDRLDLEVARADVIDWGGVDSMYPVFRLNDEVSLRAEATSGGVTVYYERDGYKTDMFCMLMGRETTENIATLHGAISRCAKWVDEQIVAAEAEAYRVAEQERKRQGRAAAKATEDVETARALAATRPAITIARLDHMLWHITKIKRVLKAADGLAVPFRSNVQLEALEMLRQLVDSANEVAAKLAQEKAGSDDIPF